MFVFSLACLRVRVFWLCLVILLLFDCCAIAFGGNGVEAVSDVCYVGLTLQGIYFMLLADCFGRTP